MPNTLATLAFLPKHPRYEIEKPYVIIPSADNSSIEDSQRTNVEVERRDNILIRDINNCDQKFRLDTHGFEVLQHKTQYPELNEVSQCKAYKRETAELLEKHFDAERVITCDLKVRRFLLCAGSSLTQDRNDMSRNILGEEHGTTMTHDNQKDRRLWLIVVRSTN